jgi:hypothetical protein
MTLTGPLKSGTRFDRDRFRVSHFPGNLGRPGVPTEPPNQQIANDGNGPDSKGRGGSGFLQQSHYHRHQESHEERKRRA